MACVAQSEAKRKVASIIMLATYQFFESLFFVTLLAVLKM